MALAGGAVGRQLESSRLAALEAQVVLLRESLATSAVTLMQTQKLAQSGDEQRREILDRLARLEERSRR
jgi:hypothetical protein